MTDAIQAEGLVKRFGDKIAVDGVDLTVRTGAVLGLLGPNGAGKTTIVRLLTTLLRLDGGYAKVAGYDVTKDPDRVRAMIGLTGQYAAVDEDLTGFENLLLIGRLLELSRTDAKRRASELLERFELTDAAKRSAKTYSGGMRRRLDLAASLIGRPQILFLDEPTTGLDPRSRGDVWAMIRELVADGATVLLTTQYLDEADRLASEIAVVDQGRLIATGTARRTEGQGGRADAGRTPDRPGRQGTGLGAHRAHRGDGPGDPTRRPRAAVGIRGEPGRRAARRGQRPAAAGHRGDRAGPAPGQP